MLGETDKIAMQEWRHRVEHAFSSDEEEPQIPEKKLTAEEDAMVEEFIKKPDDRLPPTLVLE